jgi:diguanylate cyclase (GGDEF)-like protein
MLTAIKSRFRGVMLALLFVCIAEIASSVFNHIIGLHFTIIMLLFISISLFLSFLISKIKKEKKEIGEELNDIKKTSSVLDTPANIIDRKEILSTLKNQTRGFDPQAYQKLKMLVNSICKVIHHTIPSHSSCVFIKVENDFVLYSIRSHSGYINKDATITQKKGLYAWVIKEKEILVNNQFLKDSRLLGYYTNDEHIKSIIMIPLLEETELTGLLICDSRKENMFTWEAKEKLRDFGKLIVSTVSLFRKIYQTEKEARRFSALHDIAKGLSQSLEREKVIDKLTGIAPRGFEFDLLVLILKEKNGKPKIEKIITRKTIPNKKFAYLKNQEISLGGSLAGLVMGKNMEVIKSNKIKTPFFFEKEKGLENFHSFIGIPLHKDEKVTGELVLLHKKHSHFSKKNKEPIIFLADLISVALEKAKLHSETLELSKRDGLTGAFNHRHFQVKLSEELQRAKRSGNPFSLLMLDIDHFKQFNDNFGHQIGDMVLKHISTITLKNIREIDTFSRYGGEEFIIILPGVEQSGALAAGEKIRLLIEKKPLIIQDETKDNIYNVTVSVGCAVFPSDGEDKDSLIKKVDDALYRAKQSGRNRVST